LLRQGLTPRQVALAVAVGATVGIMPLVWGASLIGALLAARLRLNHPLVQAVNYACYPLQIALFYPFCRFGLWCCGGDAPLAWPDWTQLAAGGEWLRLFWRANLCGLGVWLAAAPLWALLVYLPLHRLLLCRQPARPQN
jgi:uncharacterized protein (DUF2062 family)